MPYNFVNKNGDYQTTQILKDGEKLEADLAYQNIYKQATKTIYIIDDYISIKTLQLLKVCPSNINIVIITDNLAKNKLTKELVNDFENDTNIDITFKCNKHKFHDRYIVIDYNTNNYCIYHCGASSKDAGGSVTTIMQINNSDVYIELINEALKHQNLEL